MRKVIVIATDRGLLNRFDRGIPVFTNDIAHAWQFPSLDGNAHLAHTHVEAGMQYKAVLLPIHIKEKLSVSN